MQAAEKLDLAEGQSRQRQLDLPEPLVGAFDLRRIVREASQALAFLDVIRLEELAISCQRLTRDVASLPPTELALQASRASTDMAVFARVIDATRANLDVMLRLRHLREGRVEYNPMLENVHGHD